MSATGETWNRVMRALDEFRLKRIPIEEHVTIHMSHDLWRRLLMESQYPVGGVVEWGPGPKGFRFGGMPVALGEYEDDGIFLRFEVKA